MTNNFQDFENAKILVIDEIRQSEVNWSVRSGGK
jgi:hypothetical protein